LDVKDGYFPLDSTKAMRSFMGHEFLMQVSGYCPSQRRRNGIANLASYFDLRTFKYEVVRESLKPGRLAVCDGTVGLGVKVAALLRLEELRSDCR
jgi:hypothetical protein